MKKFLSVLLAVMMVLSTVSFAAPSVAGTFDTTVEVAVDELYVPVEEAELTADVPTNVADYGTLLFNIDFEDSTYPASNGEISECGPLVSYISDANEVDLPEEFTGFYRLQAPKPGDALIGSYDTLMNGTNVYVVNGAGSGTKYPYFGVSSYVSNSNWTSVAFPNGYYTFVADLAKNPTNKEKGTLTSRISNAGGKTTGEIVNLTTEMETYVHFMTIEDGTNSGQKVSSITGGTVHDDLDKVTGIGSYFGTSELTDVYYVDNYKVYWKPLTVDVTVKALGKETTVAVSTNGVSALELVSAAGLPYEYNAKTVTVGDKVYGTNDKVYFTEDTTVVVDVEKIDSKWFNDEYGYAIFDLTFESETVGETVTESRNNPLLPYFSPVADKFLGRPKSEWGFQINNGGTIVSDPTGENHGLVGQGNAATGYPMLMIENTVDKVVRECWVDNDNLIFTLVYDFYSVGHAVSTTERFGGRTDLLTWNDGQFSQPAPYHADAEDTCNEVSDQTVANEADKWRTVVSTYDASNLKNLTSTNQIAFIKAHVAAPKDVHYYDNVKVFFKQATADVVIDPNGLAGVKGGSATDVATSGLTAKQILDMAGVDVSGVSPIQYTIRGLSTTEDGSGTVFGLNEKVNFAVDSTLYIIWEKVDMSEWLDADKGILLFDIDFEDPRAAEVFVAETGNKDFALTSFAKVNTYLSGYKGWKLSNSGMDIVGIENGALKLQWDGTGKWPQVLIGNPENKLENVFFGEYGTYYVHAEYKVIDAVDEELSSIAVQSNGVKDGVHMGPSGILPLGNDFYASRGDLVADEWLVIDGGKSSATIDTDGIANDDINKITTVFTHDATTGTPGSYVLMDNIKLWWRPATVDVTVTGGKNEAFETVTLKDVSTDATVADILAKMPVTVDDYGQLTGFADEDGNKITDLKQFVGDAVIQPIWTPWNVLAEQQFTIAGEYYGDKKTQFSANGFGPSTHQGDGGSNVTKAYITSYHGKKEGDYGIYTLGGNLVYKQLTPNAGDSYVHNGSTISDNYTVAAVPQGSANRVTINVNLPAGTNAKYAVVKYKFQNIPDLNSDFAKSLGAVAAADGKSATYTTRTGDTDTYSLLAEYTGKYYIKRGDNSYEYAGGEEFEAGVRATGTGDGVKVDMSDYEDKWIYDLVPLGDKTRANGISAILLDRPAHFRDMITVWDYVLVVGEGTEDEPLMPEPEEPEGPVVEAPETIKKADVRLNSEDHSKNGVRFKASVSAAADESATTIGFVVASKAKAVAAGADENYENVIVGASFTEVGYKRLDEEEITNYFDSADDSFVMAAVLKNIPMEHAADDVVARPFIKVDGEFIYGAPIVTSLYDELAKLYFVDPSDPENSDLTDYFNDLWETDEELALYIEDIIFYVNEW